MKICSICDKFLPLSEFDSQSTGKAGRRADCKQCRKRFLRSRFGLINTIYSNQKSKSRKRNHPQPSYDQKALTNWLWAQPNAEALYQAWIASDYETDLKPSVDRKDDYLPYTIDNIQLTTVKQNCDRYYSDAKQGINTKTAQAVDQYTLDDEYVASHHSYYAAARAVGHEGIGNIRNVAEGTGKTAYGFKWRKP